MSDDIIESLNFYPAWKLHRYEQPFGEGETDVIYSCAVCDGKKWSREEYGATPDLALVRAELDLQSRSEDDGN